MERRLLAEGLGSLFLAATVIGSGIMAEKLAAGNLAIALLANTAATVMSLGVLISVFAPVSGAHFNPAVTLAVLLERRIGLPAAGAYIVAQIFGCCAGALVERHFCRDSSHRRLAIRNCAMPWGIGSARDVAMVI